MWPQSKEGTTRPKRGMRDQGTNHQTSTLVHKINTLDLPTMVLEDQIKEKEEGDHMEKRRRYSNVKFFVKSATKRAIQLMSVGTEKKMTLN